MRLLIMLLSTLRKQECAMSNTFKELSAKAAQMEREGNTSAARRCWKKAEAYANNKLNANWCSARAGFCLSRYAMSQ